MLPRTSATALRSTTGLVALLFLALSTPALAQDNPETAPSNALVDPEHFEGLLPDALPDGWEKDRFTARTSTIENWGGATYLHDGGAYMQLELRHYAPPEWEQARAESKEGAAEEVRIGKRTGFYDPTHRGMPTPALSVYLEKNFAVRVVGPGEAPPEDLASVLRQVPLDEVIALAESESAASTRAKSSDEPDAMPMDPEALAALLPEDVAGWERVELQQATAPAQMALFLPEALMRLQDEGGGIFAGGRARYEGNGPRPMLVGIIDYGTRPEGLLVMYRKKSAAGEARAVRYAVGASEVPGYEGTGTSDDVVPPHGVKALVGKRFEVVVFERPPRQVSSVTDFKALPAEQLEAMIERARIVLRMLDLGKLEAFAADR